MLTRRDGIITYMSPATRQVLGYEPEDLVGQQPWIIHPDDLARVQQVHEEALKGGSGANYEYRIVTKDGQVKWVSHSWSALSEGPHGTIVSVVRDVTERRIAQEQIERHEEQAAALASELVLAEERERREAGGGSARRHRAAADAGADPAGGTGPLDGRNEPGGAADAAAAD